MRERYAYEIKYNDYGVVFAFAADFAEAETLFWEKMREKPGTVSTEIKSIAKLQQFRPALIAASSLKSDPESPLPTTN